MGKNQSASNLTNIIQQDANGNISFVSGSTTLMSVSSSGAITTTGNVAGTASYASNADLLDGLDSTVFTLTSSFAAQTASFTAFSSSVNSFTASLNTFSASILTFTASQNILNGTYATTGSNTFAGIQTVNSNLIVTGSITAQTLVVQTITSSVDFVTGSTRFGSLSSNTHIITGSMFVTGAFYVTTGSVGLGTSIPNGKLMLYSPYGGGDLFQNIISSTGGSTKVGINFSPAVLENYPSLYPAQASIYAVDDNYSAYIVFATKVSGAVANSLTERMRITSGGSVLIGTTTQPSAIATSDLLVIGKSGNTSNAINFSNGITTNWGYLLSQSNKMVFGSGTSSDIAFETNAGSERMRITSGGLVGIGTSSPSQKLEVSGTDNNNLIMSTTTTGAGGTIRIQANEAASYLVSNNARPLYIQTNSTTRMAITSGGDVGIGTASPGCRLEITGGYMALNDYALRWRYASDANHATVFTATYNGPIMYGYSGAALGYQAIGVIWTSTTGAYNYNNSTTWQQTSDIRIKQNLRPITGALSKICSLNPTHFEYKNKPGKTKTGFIAQEFEQVFEGHVTETDPLPEHQEYFEEGEKIKSIDADLIPYLVKAIQELKAEIEELKNK